VRPDFTTALSYWTERLHEKGHSTVCRWAFHEHLCVHWRHSPTFHLLYQLQWPEIVDADVRRGYERLVAVDAPIMFQLLVARPDFSLCALAGDPWEAEDSDLHEEWQIHFAYSEAYSSYEEITNRWRWRMHRLLGRSRLSGVDFILPVQYPRS
jgi:hypothetical protein